ncbi:glycoside hydrolase superfamily [Peziza echinospora]|nr:glycoside hydrolase superfamily [Peziza echinospora]
MPSIISILKGTLFLAATIPVVSAAGQLGLALGTKRNTDGLCKETVDYEKEFDMLKSTTTTIRTYAVSDCNTMQKIMPAVNKKGFKIVLGVWPNDDAHFADEKKALSTYIPMYGTDNILAITVGSEALYRKDMKGADLAKKLEEIRALLKTLGASKIPVGFADSWHMFLEGDAVPVVQASDIILANAFSYWQGQSMANSSHSFFDDIMQALDRIQTIKGSKDFQFWVGETNWPSDGAVLGDAKPSVANAGTFWKESICGMLAWGVNVFVFSAFDENWKPAEKDNGVERHWGIFSDDGKPKFSLSCT